MILEKTETEILECVKSGMKEQESAERNGSGDQDLAGWGSRFLSTGRKWKRTWLWSIWDPVLCREGRSDYIHAQGNVSRRRRRQQLLQWSLFAVKTKWNPACSSLTVSNCKIHKQNMTLAPSVAGNHIMVSPQLSHGATWWMVVHGLRSSLIDWSNAVLKAYNLMLNLNKN